MDAKLNEQPCQCELCQPNWYMGRDDADFFTPQPAEQNALKEEHARKIYALSVEFAFES